MKTDSHTNKLPEVDVEGGLLQLIFRNFFSFNLKTAKFPESCHLAKKCFLKRVNVLHWPETMIVSGEYQVGGADDHRQSL